MARRGADKREFARYPLRLDAVIAFPSRQPIMCAVQDFCEAGMFIAMKSEVARTIAPQSAGTLHIALVVEGVHREYEISISVARVISNGIGIAFREPDADVIRMLTSMVAEANLASTRSRGRSPTKQFATEYGQVINPLSAFVASWTRDTASKVLNAAENALFLGARDAASNVDQTMYLDCQSALRKGRDAMIKAITKRVDTGLRDLRSPLEGTLTETKGLNFSELSLVEKDEFEDFLTISEIVSNIEVQLKDPLFELDQRLSYLANRTLDAGTNPLGAAVVAECVATEFHELKSDRRALAVMYRAMADTIQPAFGELVNSANRILKEHGILPVIERGKVHIRRPPRSGKPAAGPQDKSAEAPPAGSDEPAPTSDSVSAGTTGAFAAYTGESPPAANRTGAFHVQPAMPTGYAPEPAMAPPAPARPAPASGAYPTGAPVNVARVGAPSFAPEPAVPSSVAAGGGIEAARPLLAQSLAEGGGAHAAFGPPMAFSQGAAFAAPDFNRAYSAAQTLMSLRRNLAQPAVPSAAASPAPRREYSQSQLVDALSSLQSELAATQAPRLLGVDDIKSRIGEILGAGGVAEHSIGPVELDAIEVIASLFKSLLDDVLVTDTAKAQVKRIQPSMHKLGLLDPSFFETSDHPARVFLNRLANIRDPAGTEDQELVNRIGDVVGQVSRDYGSDASVFTEAMNALDGILDSQRDAYESNVREVVRVCQEQQITLKQRRSDLTSTDSSRMSQELPAEWHRWLNRGKEMQVGDRVIMNANRRNPVMLNLAWVGDDFDPYVFVDMKGRKSQTLTLQQVAMYLRRGMLKLVDDGAAPAVDRAMFGMLHQMHGELEREVTHDHASGLFNQKSFAEKVREYLDSGAPSEQSPGAFLQFFLRRLPQIREASGSEAAGDACRHFATHIDVAAVRQQYVYGFIQPDRIGLLAPGMAQQAAHDLANKVVKSQSENPFVLEGVRQDLDVWCGICASNDPGETVQQLYERAEAACQQAVKEGTQRVFRAGYSEARAQKQFEMLVAYVTKAVSRGRLVLLYRTLKPVAAGTGIKPTMCLMVGGRDRNGRLIPPDMFARAANSSSEALEVDHWAIRQTLRWMEANSEGVDKYDSIVIPLSHAAVKDELLPQFIVDELMQTPVPPGKICFAMHDSDASGNLASAAELIRTLQDFGCRFVLDEFGTGQSSYEYVRELQIDFVTIRSTYMNDAADDTKDLAMVKSINELAHFMGKRTIARLAPSAPVLERLRTLGIDFIHELIEPVLLYEA